MSVDNWKFTGWHPVILISTLDHNEALLLTTDLDVRETLVEFRIKRRQLVHGTVDARVLTVTEQLRQEERGKWHVDHDTLSSSHIANSTSLITVCRLVYASQMQDITDFLTI